MIASDLSLQQLRDRLATTDLSIPTLQAMLALAQQQEQRAAELTNLIAARIEAVSRRDGVPL